MKKSIYILFLLFSGILISCNDFLDTMPDDRAEVNTIDKVTSLLVSAYPTNSGQLIAEMSSDNAMDNGVLYKPQNQEHEDSYLWKDITTTGNDAPKGIWDAHYSAIASANQALEAIEELGNPASLQAQKGEALITRAYSHFAMANLFCLAYNPQTADKDFGLPYSEKPETEVMVEYERGTMAELYEKISADIEEGLPLIKDEIYTVPKYHFNKKAASAFAARFNLFYHKYDNAVKYADLALGSNPDKLLIKWKEMFSMASNYGIRANRFISASDPGNFLIMTAYSSAPYVIGAYGTGERYGNSLLIINGESVKFLSPQDAMSYNIGMVHQHFMLVESLSITENVALGFEDTKHGLLDHDNMRKKVLDTMKLFDLDMDPNTKISELSVALKQKIEIVKAIFRGASILILDEPTTVLTPQETSELFVRLKQLKINGYTIVFISHKLREVFELCDRCSIMRKGKMIATLMVKDVTQQQISELMIGSKSTHRIHKTTTNYKDILLSVKDVTSINKNGKTVVNHVSFSLRAGKILGVAGVEGNGQSELVETLFKLRTYSGHIEVLGKNLQEFDIQALRELGVAYIPADRMSLGLASTMAIEDNIIATKLKNSFFYQNKLLSRKKIRAFSQNLIDEFQIKCSSPQAEVDMLSGGNMQKVVAAREFDQDVKLFIVEQPSRGIDVGAARLLHDKLIEMRERGCAILLISADLDELLSLSDSAFVMYEGKINAYFPDTSSITETELGYYMLGVKNQTQEEISRVLYE